MKPKFLSDNDLVNLLRAVASQDKISGLTHKFYKYPARFSPSFVRETIKAFTNIGDLVIDPFVGGGTTLTEARILGRRALGTDLNQLGIFVTKIKTTLLNNHEANELKLWCDNVQNNLKLNNKINNHKTNTLNNNVRNFSTKELWPVRKTLELGITYSQELSTSKLREFSRCILLKSGQWAVDGRKNYPGAKELRFKITEFGYEMIEATLDYTSLVRKADSLYKSDNKWRTRYINTSAQNIPKYLNNDINNSPKLIVTSPPYPGVHVLYHRWQVDSGRETPAPYWISNKSDGYGGSYYTLGDRNSKDLEPYFNGIFEIFSSLKTIVSKDTIIVQLIAFSDKNQQLKRYLETMSDAGFKESKLGACANSSDGRLWRTIPNRKWHANSKGILDSSSEVVLFHSLK